MPPRTRAPSGPAVILAEAEHLLETRPADAKSLLDGLTASPTPGAIRTQALAILAIQDAARGSDAGLRASEEKIAEAAAIRSRTREAVGRLAHARGYLAYKRGEHALVLAELNKAASIYSARDPRRAQVFDTLGMHFESVIGDLERARSYYLLSIKLKRAAFERESKLERTLDRAGGGPSARSGLALTYGNLGRLELARERFEEAERYFREDLALVLAPEPPLAAEAHVRDQLARSLLGQGSGRVDEARAQLEAALGLVTPETATHVFILKDLARVALARGEPFEAQRSIRTAREIATRCGFEVALLWVRFIEGQIASGEAARAGDDACMRAMQAFDEAHGGFERLAISRAICEIAVCKAELLGRLGRRDEALRILCEVALPQAERFLFAQLQPLARIEARIDALSPETLLHVKTRRMLGGVMPERYSARLRGERHRVTVWTCDIRGFTRFCDETGDPLLVVEMLNRFFAALGAPLLDLGGRIDKYVGDNILAYFRDPAAAAQMAIRAIAAIERLNTEREHLAERRLEIGIGLATGELVEGNVGFAGKLEHTIIGTPVNLACRLVDVANPGQILIDSATRAALGGEHRCSPVGSGTIRLKGLGAVRVFELHAGPAPRRRPRPRARSRA